MNDKLLSAILKNPKLILAIPTSENKAMSARELGLAVGIPQTTMYAKIQLIQGWTNLGVVEKHNLHRLGARELFYYRKWEFTIKFTKNRIIFFYHKKNNQS